MIATNNNIYFCKKNDILLFNIKFISNFAAETHTHNSRGS